MKLSVTISSQTLMRKPRFISLYFIVSMAKRLQRVIESVASPDTYKVVDAIVDGLTSQRPQTRYVVGKDAKLSVLMSYLPTFIGDYALRMTRPRK